MECCISDTSGLQEAAPHQAASVHAMLVPEQNIPSKSATRGPVRLQWTAKRHSLQEAAPHQAASVHATLVPEQDNQTEHWARVQWVAK